MTTRPRHPASVDQDPNSGAATDPTPTLRDLKLAEETRRRAAQHASWPSCD